MINQEPQMMKSKTLKHNNGYNEQILKQKIPNFTK